MAINSFKKRLAIIGGGPSGLYLFKKLLDSGRTDLDIDIFEKKKEPGAGMPYSHEGANTEHIANVSANEIPEIVTPVLAWIQTVSKEKLKRFDLKPEDFNKYRVLPRLLLGDYLNDQFDLLLQKAARAGITAKVHLKSLVTDITDIPEIQQVSVETESEDHFRFDHVVICTGHHWPIVHEGKIPGYFDSPYPPAKLAIKINHPVAIKGSSLTAIDAISTVATHNGSFVRNEEGKLTYKANKDSKDSKLVLHSIDGLLPAIRFHLEDPGVAERSRLSKETLQKNMAENNGFVSLDFVFHVDFMEPLRERDPDFHAKVKDLSLEEFVNRVMDQRERIDPFLLFKAEYKEAEKSIRRKESIHWKEMLANLSFAMNYPAKHFSAEDMQRLVNVLKPLISIVIASVPQESADEIIALYDAGKLEMVAVDADSKVKPKEEGGITYFYTDENKVARQTSYQTFIDCTGQPQLSLKDFPFKSMRDQGTISQARLAFRSQEAAIKEISNGNEDVQQQSNGKYYLKVPGIAITDDFQVVDKNGTANNRIYVIAVPFIGGYNPDYSGLDFCDEASRIILESL